MYTDDNSTPEAGPWPGYVWAQPDDTQREAIADALLDHLGDDDEVEVMLAYMAEPEHGYGDDERDYSAAQIAQLFFGSGKVEYGDWAENGERWLDEHYPGAYTDSILGARLGVDDLEAMGEAEARSDSRYWWRESKAGRIYGLLKPDHR